MASRRKKPRRAAAELEVSTPKSTRPTALERREAAPAKATSEKIRRTLDAFPDRIDIRDWPYQPTLKPLPDQIVNTACVPIILDQGQEGACTGYALAAVVNYQLAARGLINAGSAERLVSARMLYEMARRYDEWPGEAYEGSSARGAMKGWVAHGAAPESFWPSRGVDAKKGPGHLTDEIAAHAQKAPGGAYFRVMHRNIRDVHAAIFEAGIVYATLMVHAGWDDPGPARVELTFTYGQNVGHVSLPVISRRGRADDGHAIALVGYTSEGFIVQNSWGSGWGAGGFALLPYEDWLLHATDCWVAQLGVPISLTSWKRDEGGSTAGLHRAQGSVPLADIRPFVIDIGNNGRLSDSGDYWTTPEDITRLFQSIQERSREWSRPRIMLYLHGGLNNEAAAAQRIIAFRDVLLANEIYPVHIMWETGFWESLKSGVLDLFTRDDDRAGGNWLKKLRTGLLEARDRTIELTAAVPGSALWREMKENARLATVEGGGMTLLVRMARQLLASLSNAQRKQWELHIVGHSAGSIFAAHAVQSLLQLEIPLKTLQFMAPALRTDEFRRLILPHIKSGKCPPPTLYLLSDVGERDDNVGPYGKSLLYLVSNAFEGRRDTPILGMERFISTASSDPNKELVDVELAQLFGKSPAGLPSLVIAGSGSTGATISPSLSRSDTHGGFDNDEYTMNSVLHRILGNAPSRPFTMRDLQYP